MVHGRQKVAWAGKRSLKIGSFTEMLISKILLPNCCPSTNSNLNTMHILTFVQINENIQDEIGTTEGQHLACHGLLLGKIYKNYETWTAAKLSILMIWQLGCSFKSSFRLKTK